MSSLRCLLHNLLSLTITSSIYSLGDKSNNGSTKWSAEWSMCGRGSSSRNANVGACTRKTMAHRSHSSSVIVLLLISLFFCFLFSVFFSQLHFPATHSIVVAIDSINRTFSFSCFYLMAFYFDNKHSRYLDNKRSCYHQSDASHLMSDSTH